jgi:hypothetical protein
MAYEVRFIDKRGAAEFRLELDIAICSLACDEFALN